MKIYMKNKSFNIAFQSENQFYKIFPLPYEHSESQNKSLIRRHILEINEGKVVHYNSSDRRTK